MIEAEIDRVRSLGLDTLAQVVLRNPSRGRLTMRVLMRTRITDDT